MAFAVTITSAAQFDIEETCRYIFFELENPQAAAKLATDIYDAIDTLDEFPLRNPLWRNEPWKSRGVHSLPVDNYLVFYSVDETRNIVTVLRVFYSRRNV